MTAGLVNQGVDQVALAAELTLVNNSAGGKANVLGALVEPPELEQTIDGASTLKLRLADHRRQLITDPILASPFWAVVEGPGGPIHFEYVALGKAGDFLTITMEDAIVGALRRRNSKLSVGANKTTRRAFTAKLCREAEVPYVVDPGHPEKVHNPLVRSADGQKTNSWEMLGSEIAAPINWRRFSDGHRLVMGGDPWLMSGPALELRENTAGVGSIDFDLDTGKPAQTAKLTIDLGAPGQTAVRPGAHVVVGGVGPGDGAWLVAKVTRRLTSPRASVELTRPRKVLAEPKKQKTGRGSGAKSSSSDKGSPDFIPGKTTKTTTRTGGKTSSKTSGAPVQGPVLNTARERMVKFAIAQAGKPYVLGASGPGSYDCSGLVQAATRAAGKTLGKPVASQWATCRAQGKTIPVSTALRTRGALLFRIGGTYNHVAISLGNGRDTVEAMGTAYGCGVFGNAAGRSWTGAALWI